MVATTTVICKKVVDENPVARYLGAKRGFNTSNTVTKLEEKYTNFPAPTTHLHHETEKKMREKFRRKREIGQERRNPRLIID